MNKNKSTTTRNGWLTAEGLRQGNREFFGHGRYNFCTLRLRTFHDLEWVVVMADINMQLYRQQFRIERLNAARKQFVTFAKMIDPEYRHEVVHV